MGPPTAPPVPEVTRMSNTSCVAPLETEASGEGLSFVPAFPDLPVLTSLLMLKQPQRNSDIWFAIERAGRIVTFANDPQADRFDVVVDMRSRVTTASEFGMTGFAIHPEFPADNRIFVLFADAANNGRSTLLSLELDADNLAVTSEQVLLTLEQPARNHNGGDLHFGPDGFLYAAFGDGGADRNQSQVLSNLHGTMIRIDVNVASGYQVPDNNPFNSGQPLCRTGSGEDTCPEVFAYGFRNPWRWSFDPLTGDIWMADVGENRWEEVNLVIAGGNYGWPLMEGEVCFGNSNCLNEGQNLILPISVYGHDLGRSITGGYVYRGTINRALAGQYIYSDFWSTDVLALPANAQPGSQPSALFNRQGMLVAAFAQDNQGELYALNFGSRDTGSSILRLEGGVATPQMAALLSETGCFNPQDKSLPPGVVDYQVNAPFWSDGAQKRRQFAIPDGTAIEVQDDGEFAFPQGSVLLKHFLNGEDYIETRLLVNHPTGWQGYSYAWNASQTEASLLSEGLTRDVGDFVHTFPGPGDCFSCHTSASHFALGLQVNQLNFEDPVWQRNYLDFLAEASYLSSEVNADPLNRLVAIDDTTATVTQRARSYLDSNCAGCHRPGAPGAFIDLRYDTPLDMTGTCGVRPIRGDSGLNDAFIISPGLADESVLVARMASLGEDRMPPLASLRQDEQALSVLREWIDSLPGCD